MGTPLQRSQAESNLIGLASLNPNTWPTPFRLLQGRLVRQSPLTPEPSHEKRGLIWACLGVFVAATGCTSVDVENVRFGIMRADANGDYTVDHQTIILRMMKDTGFRFGMTFDNSKGVEIEYYAVMHLPAVTQQVKRTDEQDWTNCSERT